MMKKLLGLLLLGIVCMPSVADSLKSVVDSSDNVLTVRIAGAEDPKRIPIEVCMDNPSVPVTCVQCYLQVSDSSAVFCKDSDGKSYLFSRTTRWTQQHQVMMFWSAKQHRQSLMAMVVSPLSENFKGTTGPVLTVYLDVSSLADGTYSLRLFDSNMVWTDKRRICTYLSPGTETSFVIEGGKLRIP